MWVLRPSRLMMKTSLHADYVPEQQIRDILIDIRTLSDLRLTLAMRNMHGSEKGLE